MSRTLTLGYATLDGGAAPAPVARAIGLLEGKRGPYHEVAHVERELPPGGEKAYLEARRDGTRSFVLWADAQRTSRVATVSTVASGKGSTAYQVVGGQGEFIGTIVRRRRRRFRRGLRVRWTVGGPGQADAVGYKGRIAWWGVWWLVFPLTIFVGVATALGGSDIPHAPARIIWRQGDRTPLEYNAHSKAVLLHAPDADWRLGAALLALVRSYEGWLGAWDRTEK